LTGPLESSPERPAWKFHKLLSH